MMHLNQTKEIEIVELLTGLACFPSRLNLVEEEAILILPLSLRLPDRRSSKPKMCVTCVWYVTSGILP
jgi:hypothetical protein